MSQNLGSLPSPPHVTNVTLPRPPSAPINLLHHLWMPPNCKWEVLLISIREPRFDNLASTAIISIRRGVSLQRTSMFHEA